MSRDSNVQNFFGSMFRGSEASKDNIELKSETNQSMIEKNLSLKRSSFTNSVNSIRSSISILSNNVNPINIEGGASVSSPRHNIEGLNSSSLIDDTYELDEFYEEAVIVNSDSLNNQESTQELEKGSPDFLLNDQNSGQELEKKSADILPQGTSPISPKIQISPISIPE